MTNERRRADVRRRVRDAGYRLAWTNALTTWAVGVAPAMAARLARAVVDGAMAAESGVQAVGRALVRVAGSGAGRRGPRRRA